jgi:hypothetical protein
MKIQSHIGWMGPLVAVIGLLSYFTLAVKVPSLRDTAWLNLLLVTAGLALSVLALVRARSWSRWAGVAVSGLAVVALFGYVFGLSATVPDSAGAVAVGDSAPPLSLPDQNGQLADLGDLPGRVVVVFYRGFW